MKIIFSQHAIEQMFKRDIRISDIKEALDSGEIMQKYPDDKPYPSKIVLSYKDKLPLHVVYAFNEADNEIIVITAYHTDPSIWEDDFKTRKN